jgi:hypothetical protein
MKLSLILDDEAYAKLEDAFKGAYVKSGDGKWHLDTDEDVDKQNKLKEFRDNNIKLMKEMDDLQKKIGAYGTTPEEVKKMQARIQEIEDKKLIEAGKLDELVSQKTERMRADFENQLTALKKAVDEKELTLTQAHNRLSEVLIDSEITKAVTAVGGVRKDAMQDILARGRRIWKLEDGKPVPKEGDRILYGKDGKEPITFDEWAQVLVASAPFLFEPNSGSGAGGGAAGAKGSALNDLKALPPQERLKMIHGAGAQK